MEEICSLKLPALYPRRSTVMKSNPKDFRVKAGESTVIATTLSPISFLEAARRNVLSTSLENALATSPSFLRKVIRVLYF